jgi:hypothetical protein
MEKKRLVTLMSLALLTGHCAFAQETTPPPTPANAPPPKGVSIYPQTTLPSLREEPGSHVVQEPISLPLRQALYPQPGGPRRWLFLDGMYVDRPDGSARFRWAKAPLMSSSRRWTLLPGSLP